MNNEKRARLRINILCPIRRGRRSEGGYQAPIPRPSVSHLPPPTSHPVHPMPSNHIPSHLTLCRERCVLFRNLTPVGKRTGTRTRERGREDKTRTERGGGGERSRRRNTPEEKGGKQRERDGRGVPVQEEASGTGRWRRTVGIWVPRTRIGERGRIPSTGERREQMVGGGGARRGARGGDERRRKEEGSSFDRDDPDDPEEEARPIPL